MSETSESIQDQEANEATPPKKSRRRGKSERTKELEDRLRRLEDAIASIGDSHTIEDRVVERVQQQIKTEPAATSAETDENITDKKKSAPASGGGWFSWGKHDTAEDGSIASHTLKVSPQVMKEAWFVVDLWKETRAIFRMFFDIHYRMAWWVRLTVLIFLVVILFSHWFFTIYLIPFVGPILDKIVALALGFVLYKILSREARKYMLMKEGKEP